MTTCFSPTCRRHPLSARLRRFCSRAGLFLRERPSVRGAVAAAHGAIPVVAGPRPASRPAAPDPLTGSGRRQTGAHQIPARLALRRRGPARIEAPGAERSVLGRNRQALCRPLVRRTAKRTDRPTNPSHPTSRRTRPHRVRHRCTRKPVSRASTLPVLSDCQGIEASTSRHEKGCFSAVAIVFPTSAGGGTRSEAPMATPFPQSEPACRFV